MYFIGIDVGTLTTKLLLMDEAGTPLKVARKTYRTAMPQPGWAEQNPDDWWHAVCEGVPELLVGYDRAEVAGIGCCGQMYSAVALDGRGQVIRPAILGNDSRTRYQLGYLNQPDSRDRIVRATGNAPFAGLTAPKLLWLREEEPMSFSAIRTVMLPKDYINFRLTGQRSTDVTDASGTLLLDVRRRAWSQSMTSLCGLRPTYLPEVHESYEAIGTLLPEVADQLGISRDVVVCAGAGDVAAAAVGTGCVGEGHCNLMLGAEGSVFLPTRSFLADEDHRLHSFCSADGGWALMACVLTAGGSNEWWMRNVLRVHHGEFGVEQARVGRDSLGHNDVYFLPCLMGERTPYNDPRARGAFVGLRMDTTRADMTQAVLEGVAFSMHEDMQIARNEQVRPAEATVCGGGSKSALWRAILADVLDMPLHLPRERNACAYGAALLAGVAQGRWASVVDAGKVVQMEGSDLPDKRIISLYRGHYDVWHQLYPALQGVFKQML